jgi:hypothetical protein
MAILALLKKENARSGICEEGDVIGIFEDNYKFAESEINGFDFLTLKGTPDEVRKQLVELNLQKLAPADSNHRDINQQKYIIPKYPWKVTNPKGDTVVKACSSKIEAK